MIRALVVTLAFAVLPASSAAQSVAAPWDAFLGCWVSSDASDTSRQLCYVPVDGMPSAVLAVDVRGDSILSRGRLRTSEARQPIATPDCEGFEIIRASVDGARIYTEGEIRCGTARQGTSALLSLSVQGQLVRVLAIRVGEQQTLITERYDPVPLEFVPAPMRAPVLAAEQRAQVARVAVRRPLDVEQIETMLQETDPVVVEAWMVEATRDTQGFRASRRVLERLAAAGAGTGVIDMAVMLSNPFYFEVHAATTAPPIRDGFGGGLQGAGRGCEYEPAMMPTVGLAYLAAWGYPAFVNPWLFSNHCLPFLFHNPFGLGIVAFSGWSPFFVGDRVAGAVPLWWRTSTPRTGFAVPVAGGSLTQSIPLGRVEKGRGYARRGASGAENTYRPAHGPRTLKEAGNWTRDEGAATASAGGNEAAGSSGRTRTESSGSTGRTAEPRKP